MGKTKDFLEANHCTVVAFWGENYPDLNQVLEVYAKNFLDGLSHEDIMDGVMLDEFPEIYEDMEIATINHGDYSYSSATRRVKGCPHYSIYLGSDIVPSEN